MDIKRNSTPLIPNSPENKYSLRKNLKCHKRETKINSWLLISFLDRSIEQGRKLSTVSLNLSEIDFTNELEPGDLGYSNCQRYYLKWM